MTRNIRRHLILGAGLVLGLLLGSARPADAQTPTFRRQWSTRTGPVGIAVSDVYIFVGETQGVAVYSLTDSLIGEISAAGNSVAADTHGNLYTVDDYYTVCTNVKTALWSGGEVWRYLRLARSESEPSPGGIAADSDGRIYSTHNEAWNGQSYSAVTILSSAGLPLGGGFATGCTSLGIAVDDSGNLFFTDADHHRVVKMSPYGALLQQWGTEGSGAGQFERPAGIAIGPDESIYVVDTGNFRVQVFTFAGAYVTQFGVQGSGPGQFTSPSGVATDGEGNVYVSDYNTKRVEAFGAPLTPVKSESWGHLKALYR